MRCASVESAARTSQHAIFDVRYALPWWCVGETGWQHRPCLAWKGFLALVRCARQGARFVDATRRRCVRWSFESPRLMCRFLSYIKRRASNGGVHQKLCGRLEKGGRGPRRPKAKQNRGRANRLSGASGIGCRSSQKRRRSFCSSAFGRALDGNAMPGPYLKATK